MEKQFAENNHAAEGDNTNGGVKAIPPWTPRGLHRMVQTRMAEMGVRPNVMDRVLNHNLAGFGRHYDHYSYYPEIRKALIRWDRRLRGITAKKTRGIERLLES